MDPVTDHLVLELSATLWGPPGAGRGLAGSLHPQPSRERVGGGLNPPLTSPSSGINVPHPLADVGVFAVTLGGLLLACNGSGCNAANTPNKTQDTPHHKEFNVSSAEGKEVYVSDVSPVTLRDFGENSAQSLHTDHFSDEDSQCF